MKFIPEVIRRYINFGYPKISEYNEKEVKYLCLQLKNIPNFCYCLLLLQHRYYHYLKCKEKREWKILDFGALIDNYTVNFPLSVNFAVTRRIFAREVKNYNVSFWLESCEIDEKCSQKGCGVTPILIGVTP